MKKKVIAVALAACFAVSFAACGSKSGEAASAVSEAASAVSEAVSEAASAVSEAASAVSEAVADVVVMSHEEYVAAPVDSLVCVETYVQAKQSWWQDTASVYCQSEDGAYFLYSMPCSEEEFNTDLAIGNKIRVTGYKSEWSGEVEITDATYEVIEGETFVAEPVDVTALLGTEELNAHQNELVSFTGLTVADKGDGAAFLYKWDGSGVQGDDLYFDVTDAAGNTYSFTVESYLCGADTEVYQTVENLKVGDVVDMTGFLYWYEGPNPHITSVTVK